MLLGETTYWDKFRTKRLKVRYHGRETFRDRWIVKIAGIAIHNPSLRLPEAVDLFFELAGSSAASYWDGLSDQGRKRFYKDLAKTILEVLCA